MAKALKKNKLANSILLTILGGNKYVHESCLIEWIERKRKLKKEEHLEPTCDICKTKFYVYYFEINYSL